MRRTPPENRTPMVQGPVQPSAAHAELALREAIALMAPVVSWLLRHGVTYPNFTETLKLVFLEAARGELVRDGAKPTQSALSLLSGVHRKDVRTLEQAPQLKRAPPRPPLSSQAFTIWLTDPRYRAADGKPRALARSGPGRSFEALCRSLSNDVHPRSVLDELIRLGHVGVDGDRVVALTSSFVPSKQIEELTSVFAANAADHLAAAVSNLTQNMPKFLEQSIYADGLTPESIDKLHQAARRAWDRAFESVVTKARERVDRDNSSDGDQRMRFGVYFYSESMPEADAPPAPTKASPSRKRAATRSKS